MKLTDIRQAAGGNNYLSRALRDIENWMNQAESKLGIAPIGSQQATSDQRSSPPNPPILTVTGGGGSYQIHISKNANDPDTIYRMQLQYGSTLPFETASDLTTIEIMGDDILTSLAAPNTAYYFRARAKFNNSDWGAWTNGPGLVFSTGSGGGAFTIGLAGASLVALQAGGTKAASAVVVGDVLSDLSGTGVTVSAVFSFAAQANSQMQSTNGGPLALGAQTDIVQLDGNYKQAGALQIGDSVLVLVSGSNIGDTVTALAAQPDAILYAFRTDGSQTMNASGIWCRIRL